MTHTIRLLFLLPLAIYCSAVIPEPTGADIEKRIDSLLQNMSIQQKIGQTALRGLSSRFKGELPKELKDAVKHGKVGAFLNVMNERDAIELQHIATEESQHKIPLLFARDVIHGFKTIAPIPLGLAATWDPEIVRQTARIAAIEASSYGVRWTFAPMVDISRDARWGRIAESLGEDPYLASDLAVAMVKGFQGDDLSDPTSLAACVKHYAGYGAAEGGRDYNSTYIPEPLLRDIYLPSFEAAAKAGAATFMSSFNELNGIPATGNYFLLTEVLKNEWNFDGFIVSDWDSLTQMVPHGYAADNKHAAERAANAGLDMEMVSTAYEEHLETLIIEGKIRESQLDDFVRRILRIKMRLGLFENPGFNPEGKKLIQNPGFLAAAQKAAAESAVLLKNKNAVLPLRKEQRIAVIGPLADAPHEQLGTWTFDGDKTTTRTPLPALRKHLGENKVSHVPGLAYSRSKDKTGFSSAIKAAENSDIVLFFGGEEAILSGEAHSRADISLPGAQEELIEALSKTGKPVVLIIMAGRPISVYNIINKIDAMLMAWHPGTMGGPALVDLLYGKTSPSGRLPVTWPKTTGQIPVYYNHTNTGRPAEPEKFISIDDIEIGTWQSALNNTSYYLDLGHAPQFPFGFGLTYSSFAYKNLKLNKSKINLGDTLKISAQITNTGSRTATEVAQLYVQDIVGEVTRPVRELKGYKKITLKPGKTATVQFDLHTDKLAYHNIDGERVIDPGEFNLWVGPNAAEGPRTSFTVR
jgi:beta-glucosidase